MKTNNDLVLASYIYFVTELPLRPLIKLDASAVPFEPEQQVLIAQKNRYLAYSLFLRWIRLGETPGELLFSTPLQHYEPHARFWNSVLDLAIEVYPRSGDEVLRSFESPAELWFTCLANVSQRTHEQILIGALEHEAKKKAIVRGIEACHHLDNLEVPLQGAMPDCLTTTLICKAREIAQIEPKFDKRVYRPFIKTWKRFLRYADKHEILQIGQIQGNNQLFITGKNKKPSAKKRDPHQGG
jgi:hypothetical protein